jgi:leader peptidase (prepilin peptidase) / N-methyltransferase
MTSFLWLAAAGLAGVATAAALTPLTRRVLRGSPAAPTWTTPTATGLTIAATAAMFTLLAWRIPTIGVLLAGLCFAAVAPPLTIVDLAVRRLPDILVGPAYIAAALTLTTASIHNGAWWLVVRALICSVAVAAGMLVLALARPGQLGLGDVKLAGLTALVTGAVNPTAAAIATAGAFVAAAGVGAVLIVAGRATMRSNNPFGPYLLIAALATLITIPQ